MQGKFEKFTPAGGEIIEAHNRMARAEKRVDQVAADEARSTGNEGPQTGIIRIGVRWKDISGAGHAALFTFRALRLKIPDI